MVLSPSDPSRLAHAARVPPLQKVVRIVGREHRVWLAQSVGMDVADCGIAPRLVPGMDPGPALRAAGA
jgi:hypothetical protein